MLADRLDCALPTSHLVDAIWAQAAVKVEPRPFHPRDHDILSLPIFAQSHLASEAQRGDAPRAALTAGCKKDVVLSALLRDWPDRVVIYGWHHLDGRAIQPRSEFGVGEDDALRGQCPNGWLQCPRGGDAGVEHVEPSGSVTRQPVCDFGRQRPRGLEGEGCGSGVLNEGGIEMIRNRRGDDHICGFDDAAHRVHAREVAGSTRQPSRLSPPAIPIHDDGHVNSLGGIADLHDWGLAADAG
jgi:hypothetical protein